MADEEKEALDAKLSDLGYSMYKVVPGVDDVEMLEIDGCSVCGVAYALSLSDASLEELIDEALAGRDEAS